MVIEGIHDRVRPEKREVVGPRFTVVRRYEEFSGEWPG